MDLDNLQQNMNTRVVFKEPRGMIRWIQLLFAIVAFSTVVDFYTTVDIDITCPPVAAPAPTTAPVVAKPATIVAAPAVVGAPSAATGTAPAATSIPAATNAAAAAASPTIAPSAAGANPVAPAAPTVQPVALVAPLGVQAQANPLRTQLVIAYPFDFKRHSVNNSCPGANPNLTYPPPMSALNGSPQFFVMTGVLSLLYAALSLLVYLLYSSTYESIPVLPVADLIVTALLCLFWFIASSSFSSGVSLLKSTAQSDSIFHVICSYDPKPVCTVVQDASWRGLNVALLSGFTSFFCWGAGLWFVFKETHFHAPRNQFGPP